MTPTEIAKGRELLVDRLMLSECLARIEELVAAIRANDKAARAYFEVHGAEHSDEKCPEDDTCECPEHQPFDEAHLMTSRAVELAERRATKLRAALATEGEK